MLGPRLIELFTKLKRHFKGLFIQNATAAWQRSRRNGRNKTN